MGIKLTITAPGLNLGASLRDEALADLIALTQKYRDQDLLVETKIEQASAQSNNAFSATHGSPEKPSSGTPEEGAKRRISELAAGELLNMLNWGTYSEKILILAAWGEARGLPTPWKKEDIEGVFQQAKERPPANFARDVSSSIKSGWIHAETPRTYIVTRSGWNRLAGALT